MSISSSGCITVSAPESLTKSFKKPNVKQISFEEEIEEAPGDPKNPEELKLAYARWMEDLNKLMEARKHYSDVAESQPENVEAILGLARLDQVTGQYAEAEQKFKRAVKINPQSAEAQFGLGQFYASHERWSEAIKPLTAAMFAAPDHSNYRYQLAVALTQAGDIDSALPHFIRTVGDAEGHYNVGLILQQKGQLTEAEKHFLMAVTKKPELQQAQQRLAQLRKQRDEAPTQHHQLGMNGPVEIVPDFGRPQKPTNSFSAPQSGPVAQTKLRIQQPIALR